MIFLLIKTILFWIFIILGVLILLVLLFCIIPLRYVFDIKYRDRIFSLIFKFCFIKFSLIIGIGTPFSYKAKFLFFVLADSAIKKKKQNDDGVNVGNTDFIKDKSIENEITIDKHTTNEMVKRANEYKKEIENREIVTDSKETIESKNIEKSVIEFIDSYKKYLPLDLIDALKIMVHEWMGYYKQLLPRKIKTKTEFGIDDPYSVGLILAMLSPMYAKYGKDICILPHFDKMMLDMEIFIIGWPQIIFIAIPVVRMFLNKRFREIIFKDKLKV